MNGELFSLSENGPFRYQLNDNETQKNTITKQGKGPRWKYASNRPATGYERLKAYRQRKKRAVHFWSDTDQWSTPDELFATLDAHRHRPLNRDGQTIRRFYLDIPVNVDYVTSIKL